MKILCDVCVADEAAVFCFADEAALCPSCDHRVHRANKVAGKHSRFSLLSSSSSQPHPLCDICQERRGFLFCKEDRAILCHDCDSSIHAANGLTMKHSRFILTGTRLASSPLLETSVPQRQTAISSSSGTSSISEYLIKMLPGFRVEDFLVDDSINYAAGHLFYESNDLLPPVKTALEVGNIGTTTAADWNFCVPDAPPDIHPEASLLSSADVFDIGEELSYKEASRVHHFLDVPAAALLTRIGREQWSTEDVFTVP